MLRDVQEGYVTPRAAWEAYGVEVVQAEDGRWQLGGRRKEEERDAGAGSILAANQVFSSEPKNVPLAENLAKTEEAKLKDILK